MATKNWVQHALMHSKVMAPPLQNIKLSPAHQLSFTFYPKFPGHRSHLHRTRHSYTLPHDSEHSQSPSPTPPSTPHFKPTIEEMAYVMKTVHMSNWRQLPPVSVSSITQKNNAIWTLLYVLPRSYQRKELPRVGYSWGAWEPGSQEILWPQAKYFAGVMHFSWYIQAK